MKDNKKFQVSKTTLRTINNTRISGLGSMIAVVIWVLSSAIAIAAGLGAVNLPGDWIAIILITSFLIGFYIMVALKVAKQWEKAVVLHNGKYKGLQGPGLFWITPVVDTTPVWIDHRVMVTPFNAEKTLTKDAT